MTSMKALFDNAKCKDCAQASAQVWHIFSADCPGCAARALARGPHFKRCRDAGRLDRQYRAALDLFGLTHEQVRAAAAVDRLTAEERG